MGVLFAIEHGKFNVESKNGKKIQQNICGFSDNLIALGKCKFYKMLWKYS